MEDEKRKERRVKEEREKRERERKRAKAGDGWLCVRNFITGAGCEVCPF